ncbi:hypothetical protein CW731_11065 [Polaribacter sp. ALD11]|uniref:DUF5074 domain-containing protein n=1 Tax=Polaribacter sp. ALD11 TaxID=2058137 RepID=UPI000C30E7E4|nr:DUF5074 domain-containing protein [Polaribacter sp. ALD11]AUC85793.1 hypothetical protein CW731_11065 [Polaribacter sp. ALD11]
MRNLYSKIILLCIITLAACSKETNLLEETPIFDTTFILSLESDNTSLTYLNKDKYPTLNVYSSANSETTSFSEFNNKLYLVSQNGPSFISILDLETLSLENTVTTSKVGSPSYLQMYSDTDGLVINTSGRGRRKKYNLSTVNTVTGIGESITGTSNAVLFNNAALLLDGENVLIADGKELKSFDINTKTIKTLLTFSENISGVLRNNENNIWVATEKRTALAAFTKLKNDYTISETVEITNETINLFKNSILNMNSNSETAYWSESASGKIYRFNTTTKTVEEFASPINNSVALNTVVKEHPVTKQVYVAGLEDFFNPDNSILAIYNNDKSFAKEVKSIGVSPIDIYFSNKVFFNN